jgi:type IV secretion system protein VirD4
MFKGLGFAPFSHVLRVFQNSNRRELGNMLVCAPPRAGKSVLATSQLLTWPHSAIVNDIKGELFSSTAGYRSKLGKVFVIDPRGVGHRFDPTKGKRTDLDLKAIAKSLLYKPKEGEGEVFTERAIRMLTPVFQAALLEKIPLLQYTAYMINQPIQSIAERLDAISRIKSAAPNLATRFLDGRLDQTDYQNKFLLSAWGTLTARLDSLFAESIIRSLIGNDFDVEDIMCGTEPVTVYFRWTEADLLVLSPLIRLLWTSLIDGLTKTYDAKSGNACKPVLLLIDEAGRTAIPHLSDHASTVTGRGISLWIAVQDLSQLIEIYGTHKTKTLRNNCDTQIYYRPNDQDTAEFIERCLGRKSDYARSTNSHEGHQTGEGQSETGVPVLSAWDIKQLRDTDIIGFHRNLPPFRAARMDWRLFPVLKDRRAIPPPKLHALPRLETLLTQGNQKSPSSDWQLTADLTHREPSSIPASNGFRKRISGTVKSRFKP